MFGSTVQELARILIKANPPKMKSTAKMPLAMSMTKSRIATIGVCRSAAGTEPDMKPFPPSSDPAGIERKQKRRPHYRERRFLWSPPA
jgi:hypothetical protein